MCRCLNDVIEHRNGLQRGTGSPKDTQALRLSDEFNLKFKLINSSVLSLRLPKGRGRPGHSALTQLVTVGSPSPLLPATHWRADIPMASALGRS
eukprot:g62861.t1